MNSYIQAVKRIFKNKMYIVGFVLLAVMIFILFVYIPVKIVPGNDFRYQLSIMPWRDYILFVALSVLTSLSITSNIYLMRRKQSIQVHQVGSVTISGITATVGSIFGSITCLACASTFLSFFGVGTVMILFKFRLLITAVTLGLLFVSIHFTSQKVLGVCNTCNNTTDCSTL